VAAQFLTEQHFVTFSLIFAVSILLQPIVGLGLGRSAARYISEAYGQHKPEKIFYLSLSSLLVSVALAVVAALLFWIFSPGLVRLYPTYQLKNLLGLTTIWLFLEALNDTQDHILRGHRLFAVSSIANLIGRVAGLGITVYFLTQSGEITHAIQGTIIGSSIVFLIQVTYLLHFLFRLRTENQFSLPAVLGYFFGPEIKNLLRYAMPIAVNTVCIAIYGKVHTLVLALSQPAAEIGAYELANQYFSISLGLTPVIGLVIAPVLTRIHIQNTREATSDVERLISKSVTTTLCVYLPITGFLLIFGRDIMVQLFPSYPQAGILLTILTPLIVIRGISQVLTGDIGVTLGHAKIIATITVVFGIITLCTYLAVAPYWGIMGVAISTVFIHSMAALTSIYILTHSMNIKLRIQINNVLLIVVATMAVTKGVVWLFGHNLPPSLWQFAIYWLILTLVILVWRIQHRRFPHEIQEVLSLLKYKPT